MNLFEQYKQWMEVGKISDTGLCNSIDYKYNQYFSLMKPTVANFRKIKHNKYVFWGYDLEDYWVDDKRATSFNPLRQNIVLFICAMNDEI